MAEFGTYNFRDHPKGTTFNGKTFTFTVHPSGTLVLVEFITVRNEPLTVTIDNAVNWVFSIPQQVISWKEGNYNYTIRTTSSHNVVKEYIVGSWRIV